MRNTHLLLILLSDRVGRKQPVGRKPINEGRQMASKIKIVKIGQYTVFPCGVVGFFQVKENGKNVFFFGKSITNYPVKLYQLICSATVFPKTALLRGQ